MILTTARSLQLSALEPVRTGPRQTSTALCLRAVTRVTGNARRCACGADMQESMHPIRGADTVLPRFYRRPLAGGLIGKNNPCHGFRTGLGFGAARAFAQRGYRVIATVRSEDDARRVQAAASGNIHPVLGDGTRQDQV